MSLPSNYTFIGEYLDAALIFLNKYKWLFYNKNTEILTKQVLLNFSKEWIDHFNHLSIDDLHALVKGQVNSSAPEDLKILINEINNLKPPDSLDPIENPTKTCNSNNGQSDKKMHEITLLAPVIQEIFQEAECNLVVDIGSGLGYLPNLLYKDYKFSVLGLESSKKYVQIAQQHQEKQQPQSKQNVIFHEMYVNKNSESNIQNVIEKIFPNKRQICITGLHACADLSIEVLDLFIKIKNAIALVIMPCCYHRIRIDKEDTMNTYFENFPASNTLKQLFQKYNAYSFIRQPFLRLACQQTSESFVSMSKEEHTNHSIQCMHRAILQLVGEIENCSVRRLKRKSGKSNATDIDERFQIYLNNLEYTHKLVVGSTRKNEIKITDEAFLLKMHEKWIEHKGDCWLVEVLKGLQTAIQSICENVILLDRVEFLKEKGFHCYNRKITNDFISPRCWALIAKKH